MTLTFHGEFGGRGVLAEHGLDITFVRHTTDVDAQAMLEILGQDLEDNNKIGDTAECRYNAAQYNMIFNTTLQWLKHYINQSLFSQKTPHTPP